MRRLAALLLLAACSTTPEEAGPLAGQPIEPSRLAGYSGSIVEVGTRVILAGQPTPEGLVNARDAGVKLVINARPDTEQAFEERTVVQGLGMEYISIPVTVETLDDKRVAAFIEAVRVARAREETDRVLVHCSSGNRVAALWAMYEIKEGGMEPVKAVERARQSGLKSAELVQFIGEWARRTGAW